MRCILLSLFCLLGLATFASAAPTANAFISPQSINTGKVNFVQGTDPAGTYKVVYTAGANGSRCYGLWAASSDSISHLLTVQIFVGTANYGGTSITLATAAGFNGSAPTQGLLGPSAWGGLPIDQYGNTFVQLAPGDSLKATFATALSSGAFIDVTAACSDF